MENQPVCPCCMMKKDLESTDDPLAFLNEHFNPAPIMDNLKGSSRADLECTCCLLCTAFQLLSNKPRRKKSLKSKFHLLK